MDQPLCQHGLNGTSFSSRVEDPPQRHLEQLEQYQQQRMYHVHMGGPVITSEAFQQQQHEQLRQQQEQQAQLEQLSTQLGSLSFQEMMLKNRDSNSNSMEEDDSFAYFQADPYCQDQRRKDPVYASMASHLAQSGHDQFQQEQKPEQQQQQPQYLSRQHPGQQQIPHPDWQPRSGVLKRPDLLPKCTLHWM